jgi:ribosomal-protein-serine acetyltransferase
MNFKLTINENLSLIIPTIENAKNIFSGIDKDRKHLAEWLPWVDQTLSVKNTESNILERIDKFKKKEAASFYVVYENQFIASVGFISLDNINKKGEIGYWIFSDFQGKGLMTECVKASVIYGFEEIHLNKIIIKCSSLNMKSAAIPKKLGFVLEGTLRQEKIKNGIFHDVLVFSLLKNEWKGFN